MKALANVSFFPGRLRYQYAAEDSFSGSVETVKVGKSNVVLKQQEKVMTPLRVFHAIGAAGSASGLRARRTVATAGAPRRRTGFLHSPSPALFGSGYGCVVERDRRIEAYVDAYFVRGSIRSAGRFWRWGVSGARCANLAEDAQSS